MKTCFALTAALAVWAWPLSLCAAVNVSGRPVPEMVAFDDLMKTYMETHSIEAGVLGIMREGRVVYLRGFGTIDGSAALPENATFRIASLSKPITAAAIRMMAADGVFGTLGIDRNAFNLTVGGQNNGGLLNLTPWTSLGDDDIAKVTLRHLLDHTSGFVAPDSVFRDDSRQIAKEMGLDRPPTNAERIRWMLHQVQPSMPHVFGAGDPQYSNFNTLVLGHIVETLGGGYLNFIRSRVLTAEAWVPASEVRHGRTLLADRTPREPRYLTSSTGQSVFDYTAPIDTLSTAYGGEFDMDALLGAGSLVVSAPAMLQFGNRFRIWYPNSGMPVTGPLTHDGHDGGLAGLSSKLEVLPGELVAFFAFNMDSMVGGIWPQIKNLLLTGTGFTWPSTTSDGLWITLPENNPSFGSGGYHSAWQGFGSSLTKADNGSRLRLKAGTSQWTGRITKRLRLDAPLGIARLGIQP